MKNESDHTKVVVDEQTLKGFFDAYFDDICGFLNYYTHDRQLIEDIIQDVFIRLWEERESLEIVYMKTYLYNAARNRVLNRLRDERNRLYLLREWVSRERGRIQGSDCVDMEEFGTVYRRAVDELPRKCREIFVLSKEQRKTYKEIADTKGLSVRTVESQMSIALRKIRDYLLNFYGKSL